MLSCQKVHIDGFLGQTARKQHAEPAHTHQDKNQTFISDISEVQSSYTLDEGSNIRTSTHQRDGRSVLPPVRGRVTQFRSTFPSRLRETAWFSCIYGKTRQKQLHRF